MSSNFFVEALFPLQIGDATPYVILAAATLGLIMIITILAVKKRASAMSDDLSKQSHARFEALIPTTINQTSAHDRTKETEQSATPTSKEPIPTNSGYLSLQKEVADLEARLGTFVLDYREGLKKELEAQDSVERIALEIDDLGGRVSKVEDLTSEIRTLKDEILAVQEELRKVKTSLDEQNAKLKQFAVSETRIAAPHASPIILAPPENPNGGGEAKSFFAQVATASLRHCIYCGFALDPPDQFCGRCGRPAI